MGPSPHLITSSPHQALEGSFVNPLTVFLNGHGGIQHVINDKGAASVGPQTSVNYVC